MKAKHLIWILIFLLVIVLAWACLVQKPTKPHTSSQAVGNHEIITPPGRVEIPRDTYQLQVVEYPGFTLAYNEEHEQAAWVAYELTAEELTGTISRTDRFLVDPNITTGSATNEDYRASGYDRGHLAPAADMKWSEEAMKTSFYYSNMSPQTPSFNRGIWKKAEEQVRQWALDYEAVYVVTGPILNNIVKRIGPNNVSVPSAYYKAILNKDLKKAIALVIANENSKKPLASFSITIDSLERLTGIDFFYELPDSLEDRLESTINISDWTWIY